MKTLLILSSLLLSTNSFASSYCFDRAVFAVSSKKEAVAKCETNLPLNSFDNLIDKLVSRNPINYTSRVVKAMGNVQVLINSDIYRYGVQDNECLRNEFKNVQEMKAAVMDALVLCN